MDGGETDRGGDLLGTGGGQEDDEKDLGQGEEEKDEKTRIYEVMEWVLNSVDKMNVFMLTEGVGLWQLSETGTATILAKKRPGPGGQSKVLMTWSDLFLANAPLAGRVAGTEEQMARYGAEEWHIEDPQKRYSIMGYLKTEDHVMKAKKWVVILMDADHVALRQFRKVVAGGIVVLPGDTGPIALDLRKGASPRAVAVTGNSAQERWEMLQALVVPDAVTEGEQERRKELVFIFKVRAKGLTFSDADLASEEAVKEGMKPFTKVLRMLQISEDDERFLLKWLALVLRREAVPVLMVQSRWLAHLLLDTFFPRASICKFKMHQQLPANGPGALAFPAIVCPDVGVTLHTSSPLYGLIEEIDDWQSMPLDDEAQSPGPPLVLVCAPDHVPALAGGAGTAANVVRFIHSPLDAEGCRKVEVVRQAAVRDPVRHADIARGVVCAAAYGAFLLRKDDDLLESPSGPPSLLEVAPDAGNVRRPKIPFQKDTIERYLFQALGGFKHTAIFSHHSDRDDKKCVDFTMLCTVVLLLWAPQKWKKLDEPKKSWMDAFDKVKGVLAQQGTRTNIEVSRMCQPAKRGSPVGYRIKALGSSTIFDALAEPGGPMEGDGGDRVKHITIEADDLDAIFPQETLARYRICKEGQCKEVNKKDHLKQLCTLRQRLARRKTMAEDTSKFLEDTKSALEKRVDDESLGEIPSSNRGEGEWTEVALEKYVKELALTIVQKRASVAKGAQS